MAKGESDDFGDAEVEAAGDGSGVSADADGDGDGVWPLAKPGEDNPTAVDISAAASSEREVMIEI
jgi:hypothetical protein